MQENMNEFRINNFSFLIFILMVFSATSVLGQASGEDQKAMTREAGDDILEWGACPEFMPESCSIAVLQGDPAKPNADIFFKMQGNTTVPEHWHHSAERMVLVSGQMQVQYESQEPVSLTPGTYAYGPPEKPHSASCTSQEDCVLFIAFSKPVDAFPVND